MSNIMHYWDISALKCILTSLRHSLQPSAWLSLGKDDNNGESDSNYLFSVTKSYLSIEWHLSTLIIIELVF